MPNSDSDVKRVLKNDGLENDMLSIFHLYENQSVNLKTLRKNHGLGSWAVRIAYNDKFGQRSNTNSSNFFVDRENLINNLYKWIVKKPNSEIRNQVYAKCGTTGESVCKFCNNHKIYLTNFQLGHIISKNNGGSMEVSNLFPICATCNNSMNKTDMDLYIKKNKMNINLT